MPVHRPCLTKREFFIVGYPEGPILHGPGLAVNHDGATDRSMHRAQNRGLERIRLSLRLPRRTHPMARGRGRLNQTMSGDVPCAETASFRYPGSQPTPAGSPVGGAFKPPATAGLERFA